MNPYVLAAFCALLPTYLIRFSIPLPGIGALPTTLLELLFWAMFGYWLFADSAKKTVGRTFDAWALPLTLFVTGSLLALAVAPDLRAALGLWRAYILEPLLFFVLFADVISRAKRGTSVLAALGATLAVVSVIAIIQKITGFGIPNPVWQAEATRRVTAFYGFPNAIGLFAAPVVTLMTGWTIALFQGRSHNRRWLGIAPAIATMLGMLAILFAVSQGAMIGLAAGLGMLGLFDKRLRAWTLGGIIIACVVTVAWPRALNEISLLASLRDDSGSVRRIIWDDTARMLVDHPVFGAGLAGYPGRIAPYHDASWIEIFQYPHDIILNFWSELGLIGLAGFLWIVGRFYAVAFAIYRKNDEWLPAALMAAMTALLVHGLVDVPYFKNDLAMLFWIIVGLAEAMRLKDRPIAAVIKEKLGLKGLAK